MVQFMCPFRYLWGQAGMAVEKTITHRKTLMVGNKFRCHYNQKLSHLSPLGWELINLTGDYIWKSNRIPASGKFRRLRPAKVERSKCPLNDGQ